MEKAHGLRQPSPPMKPAGRKQIHRPAVPPRGTFSAQMLRPPSTPSFSTDSSLPRNDDDELAFVTSRSEVDNQALSPPPPPPPPYHSRPNVRHPMTARISKGIPTGQTSLKTTSTTTSKHTSPKAQSPMSNDNEKTDKPTPSVHPIDTLSKKLRQQAMELTHVYEDLEKKNSKLDAYKLQIQDQKRQLEKLREQRRKSIDGSLKTPANSRAAAKEQQKRAAQMMIGTPSTGASLGQKREELDRKLKEAEREKKKYELAAKRIEKALVELQMFQNDRMEKLLPFEPSQDEDDSGDFQAVLNEQRAYIRVLEEAVHLKATDFEITGHEELLIVLAELRHTIFEQEKDVEEKSKQLSSLQEQLDQEKQQHLATKEILTTAEQHQKDMTKSFHDQECALHAQTDEVKRQLQEKDRHLSQLQGVSSDAQHTKEALQRRLDAAMKTQNLMEAKLEDATRNTKALQKQLDEITTKYEDVLQQSVHLREECTKKQSHLDEMNALQEELLGSVDKYVGKVKKSRDKVERLEAELQSYKEKEAFSKKQLEEAAQLSGERVSTLQRKIDAAEHQTQQLQAQFSALQQEKTRLESALAEVQQNLETQLQESDEHQQEIAEKEKKCHQVEEAMAELEAALSTALLMMLNKTPDTTIQQFTAEDEVERTDEDEHEFLLDQFVLRELGTCCQALSTLTTDTSLCPSFPEIIVQVKTIGERVLKEVNRVLASWARERTNLVEACELLDSTAKLCQDEMEKRHDEIREYREQLAERTSEVEAYEMQVDTLDQQLHTAQAECVAFHALEEHAANQEVALEAKQALIRDLTTEIDRLTTIENAYSVQVAANAQISERVEDQQQVMKEHKQYADELEQALENAAIFAEQQNECNEQLNTQLEEMENSQRQQTDQVKMLEVQNLTFSSRFMALIKQYTSFLRPVAATDRSLQDHLNIFDTEVQNGDVLRLVQVFPTLLEVYISICTGNPEQDFPTDSKEPHRRCSKSTNSAQFTKKKPSWSSDKPHDHHHVEMATSTSPSKTSPPHTALNVAVTRNPKSSIAVEKEEAQLAEQLELIRGAFQSYKDDVEMEK